ncbi:ArsA family ATPase [Amycolatopsis taiwanensis]|uniref:Arsenic-transporting ATPase n=1 Tax=Amycolatopsis taiwanensis TaxID=342230 RepID=A0A9W6R8Y1_9PSEU|nr:ArsA family ATPase [Amycolatopsis taiwanensis]GLY71433.1 arsenic-transporting ATPase [Amycolatopsis taiwanensis]
MTRLLLFTGKGGVGKTTLAAATAAGLAARGHKTLVVSTDPAHSLGDAFARRLTPEPAEVDHALYGAQVDPRGLVDGVWQDLRGKLRSWMAGAGLDALEAEELTVLPGVDELLALTEVQRLAETGRWHTVVVDCGPTAETLRLLALPEAVSGYLDRMFGLQSVFAGRGTAQAVRRLAAHLESLKSLLADPGTTGVRLVLTPERVVVAEARRTLSALALRGIRVDGLVVNRLMPAARGWRGAGASWIRARRRQQDEVLAELAASGLAGFARVEHRAVEPVGLPALLEIAQELYGDGDPLLGVGSDPAPPLLEVSEVDGGYRLRVSVPLGRDAAVELARVDDDLSITVDGFRRLVALPERLRSCRITGAESSPHGLVVSFTGEGQR